MGVDLVEFKLEFNLTNGFNLEICTDRLNHFNLGLDLFGGFLGFRHEF